MRLSSLLAGAASLVACAAPRPIKTAAAPAPPAASIAPTIQVRTLENAAPHEQKLTLAFLPFKNNSGDPSLDRHTSELLDLVSADLASTPGLALVERHRVDDLLHEMHLGDVGFVDQATAVRVGGLVGANVMGFGSFSVFGRDTKLSLRLVKVETGEIVGGVNETGDDPSDLAKLADSAAKSIARKLTVAR